LWQRMQGREVPGSPQVVRDFLRVRMGGRSTRSSRC
jgi:hypothetical protein